MKKTVRVVIEKEIEIDIPDEKLTPDFIAEFETYMFELDAEDKRDSLFEFVARMVAVGSSSAEGIGQLGPEYMKKYVDYPDDFIVTDITADDIETEIVE